MIDKKFRHVDSSESNEFNCPHCNSEYMRYNDSYFTDDGFYAYEFMCENCGTEGKQWYSLVFDGYTYSEPDSN